VNGKFRYPDIKGKTPPEQIADIKRFLWSLVDELNYAQSGNVEAKKETLQTDKKVNAEKNTADVIRSVTLSASGWSGSSSPYSQHIAIAGVDGSCRVDLLPNKDVAMQLFSSGVALGVENNGGNVVVYALGNKPSGDLTLQVAVSKTKTA
jgi:hypothetical protein